MNKSRPAAVEPGQCPVVIAVVVNVVVDPTLSAASMIDRFNIDLWSAPADGTNSV